MYNQTFWADRVTTKKNIYIETSNGDGTITHTPDEGEVIQQGTPLDEKNFNNIEHGIQDVSIAMQVLLTNAYHIRRKLDDHQALMDAEVLGEQHEVTLTNNLTMPFNKTMDTPESVALTKQRKNLFYSVETEIISHKGNVGEIVISEKRQNGFKIAFTGSGSEVKLAVRIKGGMT